MTLEWGLEWGDSGQNKGDDRRLSSVEAYLALMAEHNNWSLPLETQDVAMLLWIGVDRTPTSDELLWFGREVDWNFVLLSQPDEWDDDWEWWASIEEDLQYIEQKLAIIDDFFENPAIDEDIEYLQFWYDYLSKEPNNKNFCSLCDKLLTRIQTLSTEFKNIASEYEKITWMKKKYQSENEINWLIWLIDQLIKDKEWIETTLWNVLNNLHEFYWIDRPGADDSDQWDELEYS